ncbi:hypothetical protein F66182_6329 [Fusarium sp. NRRL 66182]|nr:hypothetical protein F66182_6329 [Fusarium sp. NRRL 66182]
MRSIDFADENPQAKVTATGLSPAQPAFVPPNVRFEIDDATETWTWKDNSFDFVHIRCLFRAVQDWNALYKEPYRVCTPGGWVESVEADCHFLSGDGTRDLEPSLKTFNRLFEESEKRLSRGFFVHDLQPKGLAEVGFKHVTTVDYKVSRTNSGYSKSKKQNGYHGHRREVT